MSDWVAECHELSVFNQFAGPYQMSGSFGRWREDDRGDRGLWSTSFLAATELLDIAVAVISVHFHPASALFPISDAAPAPLFQGGGIVMRIEAARAAASSANTRASRRSINY